MKWMGRMVRWGVVPIVLGIGTTVAVAWGLAAWLPHRGWSDRTIGVPRDSQGGRNGILYLREFRTIGGARRTWDRHTFNGLRFSTFSLAIDSPSRRLALKASESIAGVGWGNAESVRANPDEFGEEGLEHATGWPVLAAWMACSRRAPRPCLRAVSR